MKNIQVTDEMYEALMKLSKEMTTQDMRSTRMPHMFQVRETKNVAAYSGCGSEIWVSDEGEALKTEEELRGYICEDIIETLMSNDSEEDEEEAKMIAFSRVQKMDEDDLGDYLDNMSMENWRIVEETTENFYTNTFFTAKACQNHIDINADKYTKPVVYLRHAWRNPQMELVSKFLCEISGGKIHT